VSTFGFEDPESRSEEVPRRLPGVSDDLEAFARVEGLVGEEQALLTIPAEQRSEEHQDRLRVIGEELDHAWEHLRERATRHGTTGSH
jgi:hypothetical protein